MRPHRWSFRLLQRRSILLPEKLSDRKKQAYPNEKTFHPKVREDQTSWLKCKLPRRLDTAAVDTAVLYHVSSMP